MLCGLETLRYFRCQEESNVIHRIITKSVRNRPRAHKTTLLPELFM